MTDLAVIHHKGVYAPWSTDQARPLATGGDAAVVRSFLISRDVTEEDADLMIDNATRHGSSLPRAGSASFATASEVLEDNAAGAFGEEVPIEDIFRYLLIDRKPV